MKYLKPTVTIGLPAYNEEKNIANTIISLMKQRKDNFILEKLVVVCDGSTDDTSNIVQKLMNKYPELHVVNRGKRMGKINAVNYIFKNYYSDILVLFDADVLLVGQYVIRELVATVLKTGANLVAGIDNPKYPHNFVQRLAVSWVKVWDDSKRKTDDSLHNFSARIYAIKKEFYKSVEIPEPIICEDQYLYLRLKELNYKFAISKRAEVKYNVPDNFKDYLKQSLRFMLYNDLMYAYFGKKISQYYFIPSRYKRMSLLRNILTNPFYLTLSLLVQGYIRFKKINYKETFVGNAWDLISSTKKKI
jgi:glycosyltransferase involved in cell wall biosynthesis